MENNSRLLGRIMPGEVALIVSPGDKYNDEITHKGYKLKVKVYGLHDGLSTDDLPYAIIVRPVFRGSSHNIGQHLIPRVGSRVLCFFDSGDSRSIFVIGEAYDGSVLIDNLDGSSIYGYEDEHGNLHKVDSSGNIQLNYVKNVNITVGSVATIKVGGTTITIKDGEVLISSSTVKIESDVSVTGNLTCEKTIQGNVVKSGNISLSTHRHSSVKSGPDSSGEPI